MENAFQTTVIHWDALATVGVTRDTIVENSRRVAGRFIPTTDIRAEQEPIAVCGYGPSLKQTWKALRDFKTIYTTSGAHRFLLDRGIIPTYHVESEPRGHKLAMLGEPHPDVVYLIASCIFPNYIDKLLAANAKVLLWHVLFQDDEAYQKTPSGEWIICGGDVAGPRTIRIARLMGYTDIHCFGIDGDGKHAGPHTNEPPEDMFNPLVVRGETFYITPTMLHQIDVLFDLLDRNPEIHCTFHGDGLIGRIASRRPRKDKSKIPMAVMK